jgi:DNA replication licensing factor MCM3
MDADDYVINPIEERRLDNDAVYEKNTVYKSEGKAEIVTQHFLKQYIAHVKQNVVPELTDNAVTMCAALWSLLRDKDANEANSNITKVLPVTIRTMESLIRLSTAHAKLLQNETVEVNDVIEAFKLFCFCNHGG